jgi:peptide/nickel transport system permease protein
MIAGGQRFLRTQWWLSVAPGVVITLLGIGLSMVSDGLDERLRSA